MAILNVNPTRSEMMALQERLDLASRGHKLLKDKQDGLIREFNQLIRKNKSLREEVEALLRTGMQSFAYAKALVHEPFLEEVMAIPSYKLSLNIDKKNMLSVNVPQMHFNYHEAADDSDEIEYSYLNTNAAMDATFNDLHAALPKLLDLASVEKATQLMAKEIETTRRRVNALEEKTIPDLEETIRHIRMKLDENERAEITRLMKIKDFDEQSA